jgi:ATP-dependent DNA helicase RecG
LPPRPSKSLSIAARSIADIDLDVFRHFFGSRLQQNLDEQHVSFSQVLSNMRLLTEDRLTVTGVPVFANEATTLVPAFIVKAVTYPGTDICGGQERWWRLTEEWDDDRIKR